MKWLITLSILINFILVGVVFYYVGKQSCESSEPERLSSYTQQDLDKARDITTGLTPDEVEKIMGDPVFIDKKQKLSQPDEAQITVKAGSKTKNDSQSDEAITLYETWHYCKTGRDMDEHVTIVFEDGQVKEVNNYSISWIDILPDKSENAGAKPTSPIDRRDKIIDCKLTAKWHGTNSSAQKQSLE